MLNVIKWNGSRLSFGDAYPELVREWSWLENPDIDPYMFGPKSAKEGVWRCLAQGHRQIRSFHSKSKSSFCPACNALALKRPDLAAHWHPTLNGALTPNDVTIGSNEKAWWVCQKMSHPFQATVSECVGSKAKNKCGVCSGKQVLKGFNDLASQRPELAKQWHPTKNALSAFEVANTSTKEHWWLCSAGHEWAKSPGTRHTLECGICTGRQLVEGINDLATTHPALAAEWHPTKNRTRPTSITRKSIKSFWWLGACGHEWESRVYDRISKGTGCHYCSGYKVLAGFNDLATTDPAFLALWHWGKNAISPQEVTRGSNRRVFWLGTTCGHEWEAAITEVVTHGTRCPYCGGNKVLPGFNDLATVAPQLAAEWHPTKNGTRTPETTMAEGKSKIWWLGVCGHEWHAIAPPRIHRDVGCPKCKKTVSKIETKLFNALLSDFPDAEQSHFVPLPGIGRYGSAAVDIHFEHAGQKIAVEYDGVYWHSSKQDVDERKTRALLDAGYHVIRVLEDALPPLPLQNKRLLQFSFAFRSEEMNDAAARIVTWLRSL